VLISEDNGTVFSEPLTTSHKASDPEERQRIVNLGGHVFFGRVFGALAVSRSFGDSRYKRPKTSQNFVTWDPAISTKNLNSSHRAIVLACDGLWDVMSHADVGEYIMKNRDKTAQELSSGLVDTAVLERFTEDNVTCIVILLNWEENS